jgi:upstream activation factor subunit UAF30
MVHGCNFSAPAYIFTNENSQLFIPYFLFLYPTYVTDSDEPKGKEKRQKGGSGKGFLAPLQLSDALSKFLGESELSRSDVIKRMWDYIKGNNLQVC